ncbi:rhodanese-like domain-containing protein [Methanosarcina sp. WH1]|nr:rhodanese-like domain-containing protein [Methanosarcina sp. WH1]
MVILDIRGNDEWDEGHIEGARHIYVGQVEDNL